VWWWIGLAATGITAVAFVTRRGDPPTAGERPRVAVTPFENETDDAAFRPVARMASDWITEGLVRTGLVKVIDPEMSDRAAESIVSGRIYRTGDTVWLHAWIVEPENGAVLRALDAVGADASDPSTALEPLRQQVLGALGTLYDPRLTAWAESALRPPSYAAYRQFVAGVELLARPRDPVAAAERFRRATELDANYLLARLWLAWTFTMMGEWSRADSVSSALEPRRDDMSPLERAWHDRIVALLAGDNEASYRAARRMVEIAPRSGWVIALANASLDTNRPSVAVSVLLDAGVDNLGLEREYGWFLLTAAYHELGDHRRELASTEEAIRAVGISWGFLGPGVPALAALGRIEDLELRLDELRDARPLEYGIPAGPASLLTAATELRTHGFHDAAASLVAGRLERETDLPAGAEASAARWARLKLAYEMGKWDDAERLLHELAAENPDGLQVQGMTGLLAARRGDTASAHRIATGLAAIDRPFLFGEPTLWRARIESVLGSPENAIALLRQAFAEGQGAPAWYWLHVGRDFDALDDEPAFQELVRPRP
jgi:TolB-like protein